jgi:hypothetical protein
VSASYARVKIESGGWMGGEVAEGEERKIKREEFSPAEAVVKLEGVEGGMR